MAFKYVIVAALLVTLADAGLIRPAAYHLPQLATAHLPVKLIHEEAHDTHPQYSYGYDVHDPETGDYKSQHETRDGDVVRGSYSLVEPDGTRRTVKYTADEYHGFNAVVEKEPAHQALVMAQPLLLKTVAYQPELPLEHHHQLTEAAAQAFLDQHYAQHDALAYYQH